LAGLGRKEFNSGDILLASEVQGYLQDQAVMVFDDATARGSAIPSPSEGMLTYNKDTDQLELYDGSAFGPVGSDSGLIHINTTTFSGATAHSFGSDANPIFSTTYDNYKIVLSNLVDAVGATSYSFRLRANTTDFSGANYTTQSTTFNSTSLTSARSVNQTSASIGAVGGATTLIVIELSNPMISANKNLIVHCSYAENATTPRMEDRYTVIASTAAYNGFTVFGSNNTSGTMSVFGYKK